MIDLALSDIFCGGSIINTRFALTAAHCTETFSSPGDLFVTAGHLHKKEKHAQYEEYYQVLGIEQIIGLR